MIKMSVTLRLHEVTPAMDSRVFEAFNTRLVEMIAGGEYSREEEEMAYSVIAGSPSVKVCEVPTSPRSMLGYDDMLVQDFANGVQGVLSDTPEELGPVGASAIDALMEVYEREIGDRINYSGVNDFIYRNIGEGVFYVKW